MAYLKVPEKFLRRLTSMHYIKYFIVFGLFLANVPIYAQGNFGAMGESAFAINHKVSKWYSINFALETRYFLYNDAMAVWRQQQVDVAHFSTLNLDYGHSLSLGLEYRNREIFEEGSNEFRITEQFNYKKQTLGVRYGHRVRAEQRVFDTKTVFRQRYRFAVDFPLNGEKLDIGEAYLVNSVEGLLSLSETDKPETDIRISGHIGWQVSEPAKLQFGLEYRWEAFNLMAKHSMFVFTTAILKI